jgi:copper chaperone CopZ
MTDLSSEPSVQIATIETPAMYADHHVIEVRRILMNLPGVTDVYASSSFRIVEVSYDPTRVDQATIVACLSEAGYLGELQVAVEAGSVVARENGEKPFFRHTAVYEHSRQAVSFGQEMIHSGRSLWPCPGMGIISHTAATPDLISKMEE